MPARMAGLLVMPELRIDPIIGRRVYIAEDRAGRPSDYGIHEATGRVAPVGESSPKAHPNCPFCAGNEIHTPVASATVADGAGRWQIRVVPNKYPAFRLDEVQDGAFGVHEVIIESPEHLLDVTQLGPTRLVEVVRMYRDRLRHWAAQPGLRHGLVFKNSGCDAGASLEHIHSQVTALPYVLPTVQLELDAAGRFYAAHQQCIFCDLIESELAVNQRIVSDHQGYVTLCPIAPRQPYEMWLLPRMHQSRFDLLTDAEVEELAGALQETLSRLQTAEPGCPYNLLLHTAPFDDAHAAAYHWHWEIVPRIAHEAGLEWGGGVHICPLSPEKAATRLLTAKKN
ncbi:MAG: galactose-1-phosphate uridylyltransferase [Pirellula sp.]|nr:galactose-1-phosphate uridylyltransferase [Pirellula sp.]